MEKKALAMEKTGEERIQFLHFNDIYQYLKGPPSHKGGSKAKFNDDGELESEVKDWEALGDADAREANDEDTGESWQLGDIVNMAKRIWHEKNKFDGQTVVTFGGDALGPSLVSYLRSNGLHYAKMLSTIPINAGVWGNHEYDFGIKLAESLLKLSQNSGV